MNKKAIYWVPSLYFYQSIPFALVSLISLMLYQQLGFSNSNTVLVSSLFMLPWSLKLFIVPFLENQSARKQLVVVLQLLSALLCLVLALTINQSYFVSLSMVVFSLLALASSIHDSVSDALYLSELDSKTQKSFVGIRSLFYQIGILLVKGGLFVVLTPLAFYYQLNSWGLFFITVGGLAGLLSLYHHYQLPEAKKIATLKQPIKRVIQALFGFSQTRASALMFVFIYNASIAPMQKIVPLYLLDKEGLNLSLAEVGTWFGIWGMSFFLVGVFISGAFLSRYKLLQIIKGFTVLLALGHGLFMTAVFLNASKTLILLALLSSQFVSGLANGAYMGYLLTLSNKSQNSLSVYTLCTSLMALSTLFFGALGGLLLTALEFNTFFLLLFSVSLALVGLTFSRVNAYE